MPCVFGILIANTEVTGVLYFQESQTYMLNFYPRFNRTTLKTAKSVSVFYSAVFPFHGNFSLAAVSIILRASSIRPNFLIPFPSLFTIQSNTIRSTPASFTGMLNSGQMQRDHVGYKDTQADLKLRMPHRQGKMHIMIRKLWYLRSLSSCGVITLLYKVCDVTSLYFRNGTLTCKKKSLFLACSAQSAKCQARRYCDKDIDFYFSKCENM